MLSQFSVTVRPNAQRTRMMEKLNVTALKRLEDLSSALLESVDPRFSVPQLLFFLKAARLEAQNQNPTLTTVSKSFGDEYSRGLHSSYRVLLEADHKRHSNGLGFLETRSNPDDIRQKVFALTPQGRAALVAMLEKLEIDE